MTVAGDENKELSGEAADSGQFSIEGKKLLLAEDNAVNMEIATELLSADGADITQAWNGEEAVEAFKASEPFAFDGILMDMQMPVMDGCVKRQNKSGPLKDRTRSQSRLSRLRLTRLRRISRRQKTPE